MKSFSLSTALIAYSILASGSALALNQSTHAVVNRTAAQLSSLDTVLRNRLNLPNGLSQNLRGKPVLNWIGEGGIREDGGLRFFRHFHDPLKPWPSAGLTFFGQYESSIHWMQRPTDPTSCREWTWSSARCYFYQALTGSSPALREQAWADTFRTVGQLMHLVVDASVPEHTRNDPHPLGGLFGSYEYWIQGLHQGSEGEPAFVAKYLATPERPDSTLLGQATGDAAASVSVARLIDTVTYKGLDPNLTLTPLIGIAEFANANFFSEDSGYRRIFAPNYPYPSVERLVPSTQSLAPGQGVRAYYKKGLGDGLPVDPVLAECALDAAFRDDGIPTPQYKCADANVWEQTALAMLPRAVGYAGALIDYFFRGDIGAATYENQRLRILGGLETMAGNFELLYDRVDGTRGSLATWALQVAPNELSPPLSTPQLPADAAPGAPCWLIFRGQLELEAGAVVGSAVACPPSDSPPPPPGQWYIYVCSTFFVSQNYAYATMNPPFEGLTPAFVFFYTQPSTGTPFTCSLRSHGLPEPPPGSTTEHPA